MSIEAVKEICDQNGVQYSTEEEPRGRFHIHIPKARNISRLAVNDEASGLLLEHASDFHKYKFVEGYEAIWSAEEGTLECEIQLPVEMNHSKYLDFGTEWRLKYQKELTYLPYLHCCEINSIDP